jgi:hypothetical protein
VSCEYYGGRGSLAKAIKVEKGSLYIPMFCALFCCRYDVQKAVSKSTDGRVMEMDYFVCGVIALYRFCCLGVCSNCVSLTRALYSASHEPPGKRVVKSASFGKATGAEIPSQFTAEDKPYSFCPTISNEKQRREVLMIVSNARHLLIS